MRSLWLSRNARLVGTRASATCCLGENPLIQTPCKGTTTTTFCANRYSSSRSHLFLVYRVTNHLDKIWSIINYLRDYLFVHYTTIFFNFFDGLICGGGSIKSRFSVVILTWHHIKCPQSQFDLNLPASSNFPVFPISHKTILIDIRKTHFSLSKMAFVCIKQGLVKPICVTWQPQ